MFDPKLKEKLHGEYKSVFEKVERLCISECLQDRDSDEQMHYLLDVFYCAQNDGIAVQKIVGKDLRAFCRDFFCVTAKNPLLRILELYFKCNTVIFLSVLAFSATLFSSCWITLGLSAALTETSNDAIGIVFAFVGGFLAVLANRFWVRHKVFRNKQYSNGENFNYNVSC